MSARRHTKEIMAASWKANRLAAAIRHLRAAHSEAGAAGIQLGTEALEKGLLKQLDQAAASSGFPASEYLGE